MIISISEEIYQELYERYGDDNINNNEVSTLINRALNHVDKLMSREQEIKTILKVHD